MRLADITVHLITGLRPGGWPAVVEAVLAATTAGVRLVQHRSKEIPAGQLVLEVRELIALCRKRQALVIVNDRLDVALAAGADGCHLGEADLEWEAARRLAPPPFILGFSAATEEACRRALAAGADYIGAGPAYSTDTKPDAGSPLTPEQIGALGRLCHQGGGRTPLVAIGGIAPGRAAPLIRAGADAVAVISAVMGAADPADVARRLILEVAAARRERTT